MPLDPTLAALLQTMPPFLPVDATPQQARAQLRDLMASPLFAALQTPVGQVRDETVPTQAGAIPIRIYRPEIPGPHATVLFFHGGGFILGDLDTHDNLCRTLCAKAEAVVVSVDYRLAPEHPFPAGLEDCLAVTDWAAEHLAELGGDPDLLAVAGDSAGGNFAAVITQQAGIAGGPALAAQLLIYPATDATRDYPSVEAYAEGYFLDRRAIEFCTQAYLPSAVDLGDPRISPLVFPAMSGLPPAVIVTAEFDPIRDQGAAYAHALGQAGVQVEFRQFPGLIHGFFGLAPFAPAAQAAVEETCTLFRSMLSSRPTTRSRSGEPLPQRSGGA